MGQLQLHDWRAYLHLQEVHYNQHGLLLLQGQGIYRLADRWCVPDSAPGPCSPTPATASTCVTLCTL